MSKIMRVCETCGSKDIEVKLWVKANTGVHEPIYMAELDESEIWCPVCENHTGMVDLDDYKTTEE